MSDRASEIIGYTVEGAPGVGKTHEQMMEILRLVTAKKKVFITSRTHSWCDEWEDFLKDMGVEVRHWWGWTWMCPLYENKENRDPIIEKLKAYDIPTANICSICHAEELYPKQQCPYHQQFENLPDVVISPIEYVYTKYLEKFSPDITLVDDCLKAFSPLHTVDEIEEFLKHIQYWGNMAGFDQALKDYINVTSLKRVFELEKDDFDTFMARVKGVHQRNMKTAATWLANDEKEKWQPFLTIRPEEIEAYYRCRKSLGKLKVIGIPALFPLFDYVAETQAELRIIDAIIHKDLLELWKKRYKKETKININFVPKDVGREFENYGSVVFRIKAHTWFPPGTIEKDPVKWKRRIREFIDWILRTFYPSITAKDVGIIQPKEFETEIPIFEDGVKVNSYAVSEFVPDSLWSSRTEVKCLHYGDLRGKNDLKDCKVVFVICTYLTEHREEKPGEGIIAAFKMMFAVNPFKDLKMEKFDKDLVYVNSKSHHGYYHFKDKYLEAWRWLHEEYEQYQAIHRGRPLNHKCDTYVFGKVPDEIREELPVKDLSFKIGGDKVDEKTKWLLEYVKKHDNCVPEKEARFNLGKEFNIGDEWARVMIRKIVADIDELEFDTRNGLKCIIHK